MGYVKSNNEQRQLDIGTPLDFSFKQITDLQGKITITMEKSKMRDKEVRKAVVDFHVNEETTADACTPFDYSFKKMTELKGVGPEGPRSTRIGRIPERGAEHRKYLTRSIWLNNNKLTNIQNMDTLVNTVLEQPEKLGWIDFSFNYITELDDSIAKFPNLKIIYLHGNMLKNVDEIFKLRPLAKLKSVTFHGNPMTEEPRYRMFVVTYLPQVVNLDFSPVTKLEKLQPKPPEAVKKVQQVEGN